MFKDENLECTLCQEGFETGVKLKNHYIEKHMGKPDKFFCAFCKDSFSNVSHLYRHYSAHIGSKTDPQQGVTELKVK